jgi:putative N6-adenine-specific DNA methylase
VAAGDGPYRDEHDLYALARRVPGTAGSRRADLRVDTTRHASPLQSLNFAALRIKDAVCDVVREATGERPSVDTRHPDLPLSLHLGQPCHAVCRHLGRGAVQARLARCHLKGEAPLKETLAAAMLAAAGWQGRAEDGPLLDPCCGAGTIAIEAAQIACGIAPGCSAASPSSACCPSSLAAAPGAPAAQAGAASMRRPCRSLPAT